MIPIDVVQTNGFMIPIEVWNKCKLRCCFFSLFRLRWGWGAQDYYFNRTYGYYHSSQKLRKCIFWNCMHKILSNFSFTFLVKFWNSVVQLIVNCYLLLEWVICWAFFNLVFIPSHERSFHSKLLETLVRPYIKGRFLHSNLDV